MIQKKKKTTYQFLCDPSPLLAELEFLYYTYYFYTGGSYYNNYLFGTFYLRLLDFYCYYYDGFIIFKQYYIILYFEKFQFKF